jgi:hypothetical protein
MAVLDKSGEYWDTQCVPWYIRWFSSPTCKWCDYEMDELHGTFNRTWQCKDCDWFVIHKPEGRKQRGAF